MMFGFGDGAAGAGVGVDGVDGALLEDELSYESEDDSIVTVLFLLVYVTGASLSESVLTYPVGKSDLSKS